MSRRGNTHGLLSCPGFPDVGLPSPWTRTLADSRSSGEGMDFCSGFDLSCLIEEQ